MLVASDDDDVDDVTMPVMVVTHDALISGLRTQLLHQILDLSRQVEET